MKAVILAGGSGTRGRPYTEHFPKAMTPVRGRPLVDHIVGHLRSFPFVGEVVVVADLAGLGGQVRGYYAGERGIRFVQDSQDGTGGDLLHAEPHLGREFVLWFADNLCAIDLAAMRRAFRASGGAACIATRSRRREETGFARVEGGVIREFVEKPVLRLPMPECLGIYMLGRGIMDAVRAAGPGSVNLSYDVLQGLAPGGTVGAYDIGGAGWVDVESPVTVSRRAAEIARITRRMGAPSAPRTRR